MNLENLNLILQIIIGIFVIMGSIYSFMRWVMPLFKKDEKIRISPDCSKALIPKLGEEIPEISFALNIWSRKEQRFELSMINVEVFNPKVKEYVQYGSRITDNLNQVLNFPMFVTDSKKEFIIVHIPYFKFLYTESEIKIRINFIPYDIRNKVIAKVFIQRDNENYQVAIFCGKYHTEFGRYRVNGKKRIKFLKKYKRPPEINVDFHRR